MVSDTFSSTDRQSMTNRAIGQGDYYFIETWPKDIQSPKAGGLHRSPLLGRSWKTTGIIFLQNNIRFCFEMIFLGNLLVPLIALGALERRQEFLME
jgi:hypothetical protein